MPHLEFKWCIVHKPPGFVKGSLKRLIVLIPLYGLLGGLSYWLAHRQELMNPNEVFTLFLGVSFIVVLVVAILWHVIAKSKGSDATCFEINDFQIIYDDEKEVKLSAFSKGSVWPGLEKIELPYDQWKKPKPENGQPLELTMSSSQGTIKLLFPDEETRQKLIRSMRDYFEGNSS